jgi:hypothetical protein
VDVRQLQTACAAEAMGGWRGRLKREPNFKKMGLPLGLGSPVYVLAVAQLS